MADSDCFYNELIEEVDEVIDELGTTYSVRGSQDYDADTLSATDGTSRTVAGLVADQQTAQSFANDGEANWIGTKTLILKSSADPAEGEEVQVDGSWFPLSKLVPIKPADITVVYMLDVSR